MSISNQRISCNPPCAGAEVGTNNIGLCRVASSATRQRRVLGHGGPVDEVS